MKFFEKNKRMVLGSLFIAIVIVMSITNLGLIKTGAVSIATLHIPVILAGIILGPVWGGIVGASFGFVSMLEATFRPGSAIDVLFSPFSSGMFNDTETLIVADWLYPVQSLVMCFLPRILLGVCAGVLYIFIEKAVKFINDKKRGEAKGNPVSTVLNVGITAGVSTVIHTTLVLVCLEIFFKQFPLSQLFGLIIGVNGLIEISLALVISIAVATPLLKHMKKI